MFGTRLQKGETSQLFRLNIQGIRNVDNDLAVPILNCFATSSRAKAVPPLPEPMIE
jgi:hypothetical protein